MNVRNFQTISKTKTRKISFFTNSGLAKKFKKSSSFPAEFIEWKQSTKKSDVHFGMFPR
jgi:hypothetical protein